MASEVREHEERSHSARYLVLIFLVCVATCGVFFSLGFLVGYNERGSHSVLTTEAVTSPPVIPPTVNPPPESAQVRAQESVPETVVVPPAEGRTNPPPPRAEAADVAPPNAQHQAHGAFVAPRTPVMSEGGEGVTLQVAALRTKQDAEALVDILKTRGYPVFLVTPGYAHAEDNLFRVQVGPFRSRADADKVHDKLVQEGFKPFIKH